MQLHGVDYIFHATAHKQIPSCKFFPVEAVKTNIMGTYHVLTAAIEEGVETVICLSTDKTAYPINTMGKSKSLEESVAYCKESLQCKNKYLLYKIWQCYVFSRLSNSTLD